MAPPRPSQTGTMQAFQRISSCRSRKRDTTAPCLPNFFTEGEQPKGNITVCKLQGLHDGASEIPELSSYIDLETAYDNGGYTVTPTYDGGFGGLDLYAVHSTRSINSNRYYDYRLTQLRDWAMTGSPDTFRQGTPALRNARD